MSTAKETETLAGGTQQQNLKVYPAKELTVYAAKQLTMGRTEATINRRITTLNLLHQRGADLFSAESVWQVINSAVDKQGKPWAPGTKTLAAQAYLTFCTITKLQIPEDLNFHKWRNQTKIPWVPLETEVDQLIAACRVKMATFLELLKQTGIRAGEAWRLRWIDVDLEHGIITLNDTEKQGIPRQFQVTSKLTAMLNSLPRISAKIWNGNIHCWTSNFVAQRNRIAKKLQNPRIHNIHFHTLRHFYATMLYHKTLNLLKVQEMLGHRNISNTMVYTHLVNFESDEYDHAHATTLAEEDALLDAGYEFVRYSEKDQVAIYRKRK